MLNKILDYLLIIVFIASIIGGITDLVNGSILSGVLKVVFCEVPFLISYFIYYVIIYKKAYDIYKMLRS